MGERSCKNAASEFSFKALRPELQQAYQRYMEKLISRVMRKRVDEEQRNNHLVSRIMRKRAKGSSEDIMARVIKREEDSHGHWPEDSREDLITRVIKSNHQEPSIGGEELIMAKRAGSREDLMARVIKRQESPREDLMTRVIKAAPSEELMARVIKNHPDHDEYQVIHQVGDQYRTDSEHTDAQHGLLSDEDELIARALKAGSDDLKSRIMMSDENLIARIMIKSLIEDDGNESDSHELSEEHFNQLQYDFLSPRQRKSSNEHLIARVMRAPNPDKRKNPDDLFTRVLRKRNVEAADDNQDRETISPSEKGRQISRYDPLDTGILIVLVLYNMMNHF